MIKSETFTWELGSEIGLDIPPEPPVRAVVVDVSGRAWQHLPARPFSPSMWYAAGPLFATGFAEVDPPALTWSQLLVRRGPLTLIYTPDEVTE